MHLWRFGPILGFRHSPRAIVLRNSLWLRDVLIPVGLDPVPTTPGPATDIESDDVGCPESGVAHQSEAEKGSAKGVELTPSDCSAETDKTGYDP